MTSENAKKLLGNVAEWLTWLWDNSVKLAGKVLLACLVVVAGVPVVALAAALVLVVGVPVVIYQALRMIVQAFQPPTPGDDLLKLIKAIKPVGMVIHSKKSTTLAESGT